MEMDVIYAHNANPRNPHSYLNTYLRDAMKFRSTQTFMLW